ncbi:MAG: acyl-CoA dehydrogenase family protein [Actinomycetota bacterium]
MDFDLSPEQSLHRENVIAFARKELNDDVLDRDRVHSFSRAAWEKCADFGIQGLPIPEEFGGSGAGALTTMLTMEALGYGSKDNGLIFSLNAQMWACQMPLLRFGSDDQKQRFLPSLCAGTSVAAHAMSEPESGSDAFALSATAKRTTEGYVLNGSKSFVTNGPVADLFVVFATLDKSRGFAGLCAFLVEAGTSGLTVGPPLHKMGLRTSPMSELFLDGCEVSGESLLGKAGGGMVVFHHAMEWERSCILACTVGTMQRQLEACLQQARDRSQFGRRIGDFQAVSHRIVDMKLRVETARLLLYRLGWQMDRGVVDRGSSALVKLHLSESFVRSSLDALQIFGAYGYLEETEIEREVRDAIGSRLYSGTSEIQRNVIAHSMGL